MCCSGGCAGASAPASSETANFPGEPTQSLLPGGGGLSTCNCDELEQYNCVNNGGLWDDASCACNQHSPIVLDVQGDGFHLTTASAGVRFDLNADGTREQLAWTAQGSDEAWLCLDRNASGTIDNGQELFGNFTPHPRPPQGAERNGFLALAVYDRAGNGGNQDGMIDKRDAVFSSLRLWRDTNHNGFSEAGELQALPTPGIVALHLNYKESKRVDASGNAFKYRAKVDAAGGAQVARWAWDVFLVKTP